MSNLASIFKAYDIRGKYPEEINEQIVYKIAQAFVKFLKAQNIVVGRDMRISSPALFEALTKGLIEAGINAVDIGLCSTPLFYFAIQKEKADAGMMITASHNPAQYNGLKLCRKQAISISAETGLQEIKNLVINNQYSAVGDKKGKVIKKDLLNEYIEFILNKVRPEEIKPLKIIIDCGNGMIGPEILEISKKLACRITTLFAEPDGAFPNHEANPSKEEFLAALKEKIIKEKADLGMAFDGDGDRVIFIDEKGQVIRGDFITALISQDILKEKPGQKILYEVRSSWIVPEIIRKNKGIPVLGRAGHSLIKDKIKKENICFAGELSGHYFFEDLGYIDNALLAMLKVLKIISRDNKPFSEMIKPFKKYCQSGEINFEAENKEEKIKLVEEKHRGAKNVFSLDGLTVEYNDWWFNLRPSNTEPLLRLNIEAVSKKLLNQKIKELQKLISS